MYQCISCRGLFWNPTEEEKEYGCAINTDVCPFCYSKNFIWFLWYHKTCPYCGEEIDYNEIEDEENFEYQCKACKLDIIVKDGSLEE